MRRRRIDSNAALIAVKKTICIIDFNEEMHHNILHNKLSGLLCR